MKKKAIPILWLCFALAIIIPAFLIVIISNDGLGKLPSTDKLENPDAALATEIYSADGVLLGKYFNENRSPVDYDHISKNLLNALIATEDARYLDHSGIDFTGLLRAILKPLLLQGSAGGASTISQQLAKNLFGRPHFAYKWQIAIQKMKEWVIAVRLERFYTKEEIIAMYLNTVEFGNNAYGIKSASYTYFNKSPGQLSVPESAVLVGLLKAPTQYSPIRHPKNALGRRNTVIGQMTKYDYITNEEKTRYSKEPILLDMHADSHDEGEATYFREYIRGIVKRVAEERGLDLYSDGLKIYTTLDSRMQQYAEEAAYRHMKEMQAKLNKQFEKNLPWADQPEIIDMTVKRSERFVALHEEGVSEVKISRIFSTPVRMKVFSYRGTKDTTMSPLDSIKYYKYFLQPGFMAMEPGTGHVKAWVGGVDFKFFKYDHVNPNARRQVGSTFKPFVYAAAIREKYSPCEEVPNVPVVFEKYDNWQPKNSDGKYGGKLSLRDGLAQSVNCITAWIMKQVGVTPVIQLAKKMGITSELPPYPALCLGVADISVYEMVSAFNTFNNKGVYTEPQLITRIEDKNGNVIRNFVPKTEEALDEKSSYIMIDMLKGVTAFKGTAHRLRFMYKLDAPMAGKTGTTQNHSDAWFIGMVPKLTAGVWVGCEERAVHFNSMFEGQGASLALPIYAYFMQKIYEDKSLNFSKEDWEKPKDGLDVEIDCSKYNSSSHDNGQGEDPIY
jgi:penicillin-binding protein 1A